MEPVGTTVQQLQQRERHSHLSPLMQELAKGDKGDKRIWCPFGCTQEQVDEHGYCRHLIGFTVPGDAHVMEPMRMDEASGRRKVFGGERLPVKKTDQLVLITTSSRVYRDVDEFSREEVKAMTLAELHSKRLEEEEARLEEATRPAKV